MGAEVIALAPRRPAVDPESILHDMRGPLSAIRGQCHAIVRCAGTPGDLVDRLGIIDREVERILGSINQLRAALRGVARDEPHVRVDLFAVVRSTVRRYDGMAGEGGITLRVVGPPNGAPVCGAAGDLERVVDNLVRNAIHFAPYGTAVTIDLEVRGDAVLLRVIDEGRGLHAAGDGPAAADGATRSDGWGIGLAIVGDIVARHSGRLSLGTPAAGTSVQVVLPGDGPAAQVVRR